MKIAVEGCAHGELEKIYQCIETLQEREGIKIDVLICCGDFQAVRNTSDLCTMAVPEKYHNMCSFYKYYSGEKMAPILTIFIGGNHEASNYLQELPFGGWVAPNIYYLGRAGVIRIGNLRIGGLSGIFKAHDYLQGLWECVPYNKSSMRTVYHIRSLDVFRLSQLKEKIHVMLSHDWPTGITDYGDKEQLLRFKPFFRQDIEANELGSAPAEKLLKTLQPDYWFSAHLHCQFVALVEHDVGKETKFLALDKCLPKRRHLQILDVPPEYDGDKLLRYDAEWLAILKNTNHLLSVKNMDIHMPGPGGNERYEFTPSIEEKKAVEELLQDMTIKAASFVRTAPIFDPRAPKSAPSEPILNPQTVNLCEQLGIDDPVQVVIARSGKQMKKPENFTSPQEFVETSPVTSTPAKNIVKSKMALPAPVTPSQNTDNIPEEQSSVDNSLIADSFNTTDECSTPVSVTKKTLKRRNISIYSTPNHEEGDNTESTLLDFESSPSKIALNP